ncbi:MAG: hypothetical protein Kow0020_06560 [Wenzhouxiangellaceae bacterium]
MSRLARIRWLLLAGASLVIAACGRDAGPSGADIARNNEAVALMGQYRNEEAREVFAELAERYPEWVDVRINEAIATLNRQREGDEQRALALLEPVLKSHPDHPRANYVAGLLHFYLGDAAKALPHFRAAAQHAPDDAHVSYFTGQALVQLGRIEDALAEFRRALMLDPYLKSAYYGAALALRRLGRTDEARALMADYQRLAGNPRAHLAEFRYTRMGPLAEAWAVDLPESRPAPEVSGPLFGEAVTIGSLGRVPEDASIAVADLDDDGDLDLLLAVPDGLSQVWMNQHGRFVALAEHPLSGIPDVVAAAFGEIDVDGGVVAYLCRKGVNRLFQRVQGEWIELEAAEWADAGDCADVQAIDADHDGDLDWWVANADGPNELYSNNSDHSWRRLSRDAEPLLAGPGQGASQLLAVDLDRDGDLDLITLFVQPPHRVLENDRLWRYRSAPGFEAFRTRPLYALTAADPTASGRDTLYALDDQARLLAWAPDASDWQVLLDGASRQPESAGLMAADFDGDGHPDLLLHDADGFRVLDVHDGEARLQHAVEAPLEALATVLLEPAQGPALIGVVRTGDGAELRLWPAGTGRHRFLALDPRGQDDSADGIRSNPAGIGTEVLVRVDSRWTRLVRLDRHSTPGQSLMPLSVGLGGAERADFVRLEWSDGVLQTEMGLAAGEVHRIVEQQRQLSSCPVLFGWNGTGYEFISDVLGVGGIGFLLEPGRHAEPRPWERFRFPDGAMVPKDGRYRLKISEPMQEVAYIDHAALEIYDLAAGWNLVLDERMGTGGPPVTGQPLFYRGEGMIRPARAVDATGRDQLAAVIGRDGAAASVGRRDRRFLGLLESPQSLTLEFDRVINPPGSRPVLVASGWVEYPYSQTVFAAWQAGRRYRSATLEARGRDGWQTVHPEFGYPAGMPREMALPLDALPEHTTALRLSWGIEIYWDSVAVVHAEDPGPALLAMHRVTPDRARLAKTGFARRHTFEQRRPWYDYDQRAPFWDTRYPAGAYTRLGPVDPLIEATDNALALVGPGEELDLAFAAPPVPAGVRRVVVLEIHGFAKDMDLYTGQGGRVDPLPRVPGRGDPEQIARLHQRYHTRFLDGE